MKLKMNRRGAWADVIEFPARDQRQVEDAAQFMARLGGLRGMKIVDDGIEVCWCMSPDYQWELPNAEH